MVESGTSLENYKTLEISIRVIIEKTRMLKFVPEGVQKCRKGVGFCNNLCS